MSCDAFVISCRGPSIRARRKIDDAPLTIARYAKADGDEVLRALFLASRATITRIPIGARGHFYLGSLGLIAA
jgi:hypothetical protein